MDVTKTAKLLRKALKAEFPGVKFSVRSDRYAGGSSINVSYTDGPVVSKVEAVCSLYRGASFDGMTDSMNYHSTFLTTDDGFEEVRMGADFIPVQRTTSPEFQATLIAEFERIYGIKYDAEKLYNEVYVSGFSSLHITGVERGSTLLYRLSHYYDAKGA
jgi:hypothetical protein